MTMEVPLVNENGLSLFSKYLLVCSSHLLGMQKRIDRTSALETTVWKRGKDGWSALSCYSPMVKVIFHLSKFSRLHVGSRKQITLKVIRNLTSSGNSLLHVRTPGAGIRGSSPQDHVSKKGEQQAGTVIAITHGLCFFPPAILWAGYFGWGNYIQDVK